MGRAKEAIITHLDKALGQDMLKKAVNESPGGQRAELGLAGVGVVAEGDLVILDLVVLNTDDAAIAEGDAKDVGSEILSAVRPSPTGLQWTTQSCSHTSGGMSAKPSVLRKASRNLARKSLESALTGTRNFFLEGNQVCPSSASPPAGAR